MKALSKTLAVVLCFCMLLGTLSLSAFAGVYFDYDSETHAVFSSTKSTIAPGIEQSINYAYSNDGKQMVYYVATADISRDDVELHSAYKDAQCTTFGMDKLTNQMAAADAKYQQVNPYFKAVAGVNGDFYNMTTGQPSGAFAMDGVVSSNKANNRPWFAVFADGTAWCGSNNAEWDAAVAAHGAAQEAVGGSQMLVVDGKDVTASATGDYNTDRHSRTMVGVTEDGKVVMAVLDGRQEPFSCGGTMHELAQIMLEQECVIAINLDGGGSTTYAARQEGENSVRVINRPSDGSERSISSGLLVATTAAPSDVFEHATLDAEQDFVTPGSVVAVSAKGVSPAGTSAVIPDDVTYSATLGTVDSNGTFTSDGTVGDAVVSMIYEGNVVGQTTIHVVIPETIRFSSENITVPYGKTAALELIATYGLNIVAVKSDDFVFALENNDAGTIDGFNFTACDESTEIKECGISAAFVGANITATANLVFGKGSEVIFDFEDGTTNNFKTGYGSYNYYLPNSDTFVATPENGKVHSGNYSLGINIDYSNSQESGYMMTALYRAGESNTVYYEGARTVGAWIYLPDEYESLWVRWVLFPIAAVNADGTYTLGDSLTSNTIDNTAGGTGVVHSFTESGWHYISCDFSQYEGACWRDAYYCMEFYISDRDGASYDYYAKNSFDINGKYTIYIDDITVDYSSVIDDREAPIFSSVTYATTGMSDAAALANNASLNANVIDFAASVADDMSKINATGINAASAKAYVDGNEVACTYSNGTIAIDKSAELCAGTHTIKFSVCDNQGNYASVIRKINITSGTPSNISVVAHDPSLDRILFGSLYYIDVKANEIESVSSTTVTLNLDSMNKWVLDRMEVTEGFTANYTYDDADRILYLTVTKTGDTDLTGEQTLVSIPVRVWELNNVGSKVGGSDTVLAEGNKYTYTWFKNAYEYWKVAVNVRVQQGITFMTDGSVETFAGTNVYCDTEAWAIQKFMVETAEGVAYKAAWNGGHIHTVTPVDDKAASCLEEGYTGRTFCEVCNSIVDFGTKLPVSDHSLEFVEGILKCTVCDELYTGAYEGQIYIDGVIPSGWVGDSYYQEGERLFGVQYVDGYYYDFGLDGVCSGKMKFTGLFFDGEVYRYAQFGELSAGWKQIGNAWFYFRESTLAAPEPNYVYWDGTPYKFETNGKLISGVWVADENGERYYYASSYYYSAAKTSNVTFAEIDGNIYGFDRNGYTYKNGVYGLYGSNEKTLTYYKLDSDGVLLGTIDFDNYSGIIKDTNGGIKYYVNGKATQVGLIEIDGKFYYIRSGGVAATGEYYCTYNMTAEIPAGTYTFDSEGVMQNVPQSKNGIIEENGSLYYYVNGVKQKDLGLIKIEDNGESCYIYVRTAGQLAVGKYTVWINNGIVPYKSVQEFGADGKMKNAPSEKNGIVEENGALYYYVDGVKQTDLGLIAINDNGEKCYIYVRTAGQLAVGNYTVWINNGIVPYKSVQEFGADGKMKNAPAFKNGIVNENGTLYYYIDGVKQTDLGLIAVNDNGEDCYIYVRTAGQLAVGNYTVWINNGIVPYASAQVFDANGHMITD